MIKPALTPDEWAEYLDPANAYWAPIMYRGMSDHTAAAVGLLGQPFGFTHDDVGHLRLVAGQCDALRLGTNHSAVLRNLAGRIEALLPPREEAE